MDFKMSVDEMISKLDGACGRRKKMRDIKFRGKRIDNGEWVYGYYCLTTHYAGNRTRKPVIISESELCNHCLWEPNNYDSPVEAYDVAPSTVCQYTGLKDKDGKEIYEGDILYCISRFDNANMVVIFEDGEFRMVLCEKYKTYETGGGFYAIRCFEKEVIGNIYDNPELLD